MAKIYTVSSEVKLNIFMKLKIYLVSTFIYQNIVLHTGKVNLNPYANIYFFMAKKYTVSSEVKLNIVLKFKIYLVLTFIYQNIF